MFKYQVEYSEVTDMDTRKTCFCTDEELIEMIKNRLNVVVWSAIWMRVEDETNE